MLAVLLLNRMSMKRRILARKQRLSKPLKVEVEVPGVVYCRTCLSTEDLESIFASKEHEKKRTHELKLATGLEIKIDDGLSQKICSRCVGTIQMALQFRRSSRRAEKTLLGLVSGHKARKKYKQRKLTKTAKTSKVKEPSYNYEVDFEEQDNDLADDFQNEEYVEDTYQDEVYQPDVYDGSFEAKDDEGDAKVKKTAGKRKRQVMPNAPPYKCGTCGKEFRMKATFKAHMRFHTNYCVCETCGKRCRNNNQLQEHKRARHGLGRIHKCAYCEYTSATKEALTIHERRHTGERPYVCDHCGATFHRRSNLVQHIAIHLPEKNFQCDLCPKRLKSRKFLQIHKHNAHTGRRYGYLCAVCDHRFEKPNKVRAHARRVHGLPDDQQGPIVRVQL